MSKVKSFAILGMGKFGQKLAETLYENGAEVLIADQDEEIINQFANRATYAMTCDLCDPQAIGELGLGSMDVVFICMARNIEPSIMCAMVAKESGVPTVIAKASSQRMKSVLLKVGADQVQLVEEEAAVRAAYKLMSTDFIDYYDLEGPLCIINMHPKDAWVGKSLKDLNLRAKYNINVAAIKNKDGVMGHVDPTIPLSKEAEMLVIVNDDDVKKIK